MIIELLGLPRSGKSTIIQDLLKFFCNSDTLFDIEKEGAFENTPPTSYLYNKIWLKTIENFLSNVSPQGIHFLERGPLDRVIMTTTLHKHGHLTIEQTDNLCKTARAYIGKVDKFVLVDIPIALSLKNVKNHKIHFTRNANFLRTLSIEYQGINKLVDLNTLKLITHKQNEVMDEFRRRAVSEIKEFVDTKNPHHSVDLVGL